MEDEELDLLNTCLDLVSRKQFEAFPISLLSSHGAGQWVSVRGLCEQAGVDAGDLKPSLFATWLADPLENDGYAVIVFYDAETYWTTAAHTNRDFFLGRGKTRRLRAKS
jgi:hypothetical protein